jgi:hypothetical protein
MGIHLYIIWRRNTAHHWQMIAYPVAALPLLLLFTIGYITLVRGSRSELTTLGLVWNITCDVWESFFLLTDAGAVHGQWWPESSHFERVDGWIRQWRNRVGAGQDVTRD